MKNMRIPLLIAWGVAIIGIILGSFFDLGVSTAIASASNTVGLTISAVGPTIGFFAVAVMGGGFIRFALKGDYKVILKLLFFVLAACCFGVSVYYPGGEYFGINGFYGAAPEWLGYVIAIFPAIGGGILGYHIFKNCKNEKTWIVFVIIIVLLLIALLGCIPTLKDIIRRPRFRLIATTGAEFHNWWEPCKNYKELMSLYNTVSDNFKSYPSGHTAEASILLVFVTFLPLADDKFKKYQLPMFYGSFGIVLLVAFARILAAAHFLSDVSTGAAIVITLTLIANEIVMRVKQLHTENIDVKQE